MFRSGNASLAFALILLLGGGSASAQWLTVGADGARTGRSAEIGPRTGRVLWRTGASNNVFSEIADMPVIVGNAVVVVRTPTLAQDPDRSYVVGLHVDTGVEMWRTAVPEETDSNSRGWRAFMLGSDGVRVYVARAATIAAGPSPASQPRIWGIDAATGALFDTRLLSGMSPGETGVPTGDGGMLLWSGNVVRSSLVSSSSRLLMSFNSMSASWSFPVDAGPGTAQVAALGTRRVCWANNPLFPSLTTNPPVQGTGFSPGAVNEAPQSPPMLGSSDMIFANCTDFMMFGLQVTANTIVERWRFPSGPGAFSSGAVGTDNSVYFLDSQRRVIRLNGATGAVIARSNAAFSGAERDWHLALDGEGKVYVSDGGNTPGMISPGSVSCLSPDLQHTLWSEAIDRIGRGGVAIGPRGTVVVVNRGDQITAYRDAPSCRADFNLDGQESVQDVFDFLLAWFGGNARADIDGSAGLGVGDVLTFVTDWFAGC